MKTLLKSVIVLDNRSSHHLKKRDVLLDKGKIVSIAASIRDDKAKVIDAKGLHISPGWIDLRANFRDPGFEFKEDLQSGIAAARRGGFATVVLMPSTLPVADNKGSIEYTLARTQNSNVNILPAGCLSEKMEGKQLSEMYDMHKAGAVAFTDDKNSVSTELMSRSLEYSKNFDGLIMSFPYENGLSAHGQVNESPTSVALGMKGIPNVAEEIRLQRDIDLLRYSGGRLHVSLISSAKSVELIRKAKKEGLMISCAVAAHQLSFLDEDLMDFDTNLKVLPPFRSKDDRKALIAGIKDGTIDAICSDHSPEDVEHKLREFEDADFGISGIESAFCTAFTALEKQMSLEEILAKFTTGPAGVLRLAMGKVEDGNEGPFTIFSTEENTNFTEASWLSKSANNPFANKELRGRIYS